ncbi:hypothetical protein JL107_08265 [Nakamurella flavida]|uniref:Ketohydroxyglutarate aldolase n=1 Tax=Nakamurella flavida TaxID=363630 RepID=A0A939C2V7_9ACTN|nr:hypothetical protein [Nakamurella flavida]MBM9476431.1 hypothetical protein [Nakamurella flavida]MDP9779468.1 methylmalonyl-CoA mutase cobalamin-binding subunit [Nakamurella flavida]
MEQQISITVDDDHLQDVAGVADRLRARGMQVDQVMGSIGIISGSVPSGMRQAMRQVPGVAAVDSPVTFQVAPPGSAIQ